MGKGEYKQESEKVESRHGQSSAWEQPTIPPGQTLDVSKQA
jgi:hypothetical protein